ncbi:hypothetical protein GLW08_11890 [Pontibacillus yanchengensis]|uniref:Uncharacterized protein n=1 Tax=Pontibacillus yanchengensis TaxID=462910 RepID=A0ACC7VGE4_9BACI|nr:hypothetical protein [Pontibacillus yanchengensis]MYL54038.1 hypothetical protein [Pontibacillus yanchengensis]
MQLNKEIWKWSSTIPDWQNDLLRRLYEKNELNDEELNQVQVNILSSVGIHYREPIISKLSKGAIPDKNLDKGIKLKSLDNMVNVAAVDQQYGIEFNTEGLTVIYGDNSAGKSSYAKVLKQACRAVDNITKIYPNIYREDSESVGTAEIQIIDENQNVHYIQRDMNTSPERQLSHISIYDSKCGQIYAETENSVVFIPSELQIFNSLATIQNRAKENLNAEKDSLKETEPKIPTFKEETKVKSLIDNISKNTKYEVVEDLCTFTVEDENRLEQINKDLTVLSESNPQKHLKDLDRKIKDAKMYQQDIREVVNGLKDANIDAFLHNHSCYKDAKETLRIATEEAFNKQPLNGVGSNPWMNLWATARKYHEVAYKETEFPNTEVGAKCLLCQQDLNESGKNRLNTFEDFIQSTISKEKDEYEKSLKEYIKVFKSLPLEKIKNASIRDYLQYDTPLLETSINELIHSAHEIVSKATNAESEGNIELQYLNKFPIEEIENWIRDKDLELEYRKKLAESDNREELKREKVEYEAKEQAAKVKSEIKTLVDIKVKEEKYDKAISLLSTTNITRKYNELASAFISNHFKNQIEKELKHLRCDNVLFDIKSRGVKGQTTIKLTIDTDNKADLVDVFSEGEQKALSLAFFLAEVSSMENKGGIILDDPVSSFDQGRREYVAQRLIEESENRQVIVFTHDIVFLHMLEKFGELRQVNIKRNVVRRIGKTAGIISDDLPWVAQNVKKRIGYLKNELQLLKRKQEELNPDKYSLEVKSWYSLLREAWERSVEELMLGGVIERFDSSVKTQQLRKAKVSDELIQKVEKGMTKSSTMVHDESRAIGRITPSLEEMENDLKDLEEFKKEFK